MPTVDRISTLPDELLCHILSFLPTQNAVATTILSKRWRPLWLSLPTLDFDDKPYLTNDKPYSSFRNFVHKTLLALDAHHLSITRFRLRCFVASQFDISKSDHNEQFDLSDSELNEWVNIAIKWGIEVLDIFVPCTLFTGPDLCLGCCTFTSRTLVVLKLIGLTLDDFSFVHLPSLKTLHLEEIIFITPKHLMELLNGCPSLLDFEVIRIYYDDDGSYTCKGELKSLTKLVRANIWETELAIPLKVFCNAEVLLIAERAVCIDDILAFPNLTCLTLLFEGDDWYFVLKMLGLCPKLQRFELEILSCSDDTVWPFPNFVPECLLSQLREISIRDYGGTKSELLFAWYILLNSSVLRTMNVLADSSRDEDKMFNELALCPSISSTCDLFFRNCN